MKKLTIALIGLAFCAAPAIACPAHDVMDHDSAHEEMHEAMSEPTGNADVDFARGMAPHHQMGIEMAQKELRDGHDPEMRKMARDIIKAQNSEINKLDRWLDKNDQ